MQNKTKVVESVEDTNIQLFDILKHAKQYHIRISEDEDGHTRLTQGKIGLFEKGFLFTEGQALYPTLFKYLNNKQNELIGKICDNDDQNYCLSINSIKNSTKAQCGYNTKGDIVKIIICEQLKYNQVQSLYRGRVQMIRQNLTFGLKFDKNSEILEESNEGDLLYILINHKPIQINYVNFIIQNK